MGQVTEYARTTEAINMHLETIQKIIERMAVNSASCKMWSVTLVSAFLVVARDLKGSQYLLVAIVPIVCFLCLDSYYLSLERRFRGVYNTFMSKAVRAVLLPQDFCITTPDENQLKEIFSCLRSFSIWSFYVSLFAVASIVWVAMGML